MKELLYILNKLEENTHTILEKNKKLEDEIETLKKESLYKFITNGNLYATLNKGTFGDTAPTHTEGIELNGDINVLFLSKVCKYETINKN